MWCQGLHIPVANSMRPITPYSTLTYIHIRSLVTFIMRLRAVTKLYHMYISTYLPVY